MLRNPLKNKALVGSLFALGLFTLSGVAAAAQPATAGRAGIGVGLHYGFEMNDWDSNPWGLGFAAQGGYTLDNKLYLGLGFEYFLGESDEVNIMGNSSEWSANFMNFMGAAGYDFAIGHALVLRPKVSLGVAAMTAEGCLNGTCQDHSESEFMLGLGAEVVYVGEGFSISPELRYDFVFSDETINAVILGVNAGVFF